VEPAAPRIREMVPTDYPRLRTLWEASEGVGLSDADSPEGFEQFLRRNPGMSSVALDGELLIGGVLCGHDGRRGYIHHLAVSSSHRRRGVARCLVARSLSRLGAEGIQKCHVFVFGENEEGRLFWEASGWPVRVELVVFSSPTGGFQEGR
jgi:ribosomal protein S18 acetylase RimI-like enzyme